MTLRKGPMPWSLNSIWWFFFAMKASVLSCFGGSKHFEVLLKATRNGAPQPTAPNDRRRRQGVISTPRASREKVFGRRQRDSLFGGCFFCQRKRFFGASILPKSPNRRSTYSRILDFVGFHLLLQMIFQMFGPKMALVKGLSGDIGYFIV